MALREVILEDKAIYMVFEYAEHDFLVCHCSLLGKQHLAHTCVDGISKSSTTIRKLSDRPFLQQRCADCCISYCAVYTFYIPTSCFIEISSLPISW